MVLVTGTKSDSVQCHAAANAPRPQEAVQKALPELQHRPRPNGVPRSSSGEAVYGEGVGTGDAAGVAAGEQSGAKRRTKRISIGPLCPEAARTP